MNKLNYREIFKIAISGVVFTLIFISVVVFVADISKDKIVENERLVLINELNQLVVGFDNDILKDSKTKKVVLNGLEQNVIIYSAKRGDKAFARLFKYKTLKGYSGEIVILTAVDNNKVIGTRILKHKETPGLGDKIEIKKSKWILAFDGVKLTDKVWKVQKRGGDFDSWSGATITPSAVIGAVAGLLQAIENNDL